MKRLVIAALLAASGLAAAALSYPKVGSIDYAEGGVSISRNGKTISAPNIGDPVLSGDLVKTQSDGLLVIAMDKNTGMGGKLTVKARSTLYINLNEVKGEPQTQIQMLTGAIGSKVSKIAGSPTVTVTTSSAVMAVRGTEYEVVVSINASQDSQQAMLVTCTEHQVAVNDGQGEIEVPAGKVLEKLGEGLGHSGGGRAQERVHLLQGEPGEDQMEQLLRDVCCAGPGKQQLAQQDGLCLQ